MNQRTIISESEKQRILKMHESQKEHYLISEQEDPRVQLNKGIQMFLNHKTITDKEGKSLKVDGSIGPNSRTQEAIDKYQRSIGAPVGEWTQETWDHMKLSDIKLLKKYIAKAGGPIDIFLNWLGLD